MKRTILIVFCIGLLLAGTQLSAQDKGLGLGVLLGEPTGLSFKYWLAFPMAIDLGAAWSFIDRMSFHLHADLLFHLELFKVPAGRLPLYFGAGARIKISDTFELGIRIPAGIDYFIPNIPMDVFLELVPIVDLIPATVFKWNAGIGARYFLTL
jgi:hypothetical protein